MEIDVQPLSDSPGITCVSVDGRIDAYTVERVEEELNSLIRIGSAKLICDMSDVEFVSSSGFKAFRRIIGFAREQEGDLKFCSLNPEVNRLFVTMGFSKTAGVFTNQKEAAIDFTSPRTESEPSESSLKSKISGLLNSVGLTSDESQPETAASDAALQQTQIFSNKASLEETVIFAKPQATDENSADETANFACIDPVKLKVHPEPSQFQNISQLLGTIGSLVGFSSTALVKLNVAVLEICRTLANQLEADETFDIEIDSNKPGFRVTIDIPRETFDIREYLEPSSEKQKLTKPQAEEWLLNYVDEITHTPSELGTQYLLSVSK